ncbi:hypothetical protein [Methanosarcina sp. 2.H.A.1B.4]|uniref:hypothetical protein n=1 Tax=Methanosarcina sp. 2.H.A.1B.4 TaxID=1483600 RepID=UPI0012DFE967|nr:hypothetical protein [Methanosarcina sp. 2.H.A.1B.4]
MSKVTRQRLAEAQTIDKIQLYYLIYIILLRIVSFQNKKEFSERASGVKDHHPGIKVYYPNKQVKIN